ncbi:TonB-dependent receptor [Aquisalinus flavus]|uniref:TonB-dependent receptor n=1 Tax=Aquisalinus flavus TaxID=1526572 RepID=A0A8J2V1I1_9PROT|nr:TonB-dependent receptor [Aquisalinus flavus]GGD07562.1 TonB-dependent receptor [Aquisalinus flavus]
MIKTNNLRGVKLSIALMGGVSALSLAMPAAAQDSNDADNIEDSQAQAEDIIIVQGIRQSLEASSDVKRNSQGVVDAITAEDIGKFPDTNLAESLQRVTGVSINRQNGEGSQVTVRGFGPDFNLVLLNGRQMPTAFLTGGAPASRSFDFGNLASEGIASVRVYKTGRAAVPTGGIGSTLNILTARPLDAPGMRFSVGAKGVIDDSVTELGDGTSFTPEYSGIYSNTFADDTFGVAVVGSYQKRDSGFAQFATPDGWRGAYLGSENNWGTLPQPPADTQVTNRPGPDDIYSVPQSSNYSLTDISRERINGQLALQYRPIETLTATLDYFYSQNKVETRRSDLSVWFNHGNTTSAWGDGPISDIVFYNEDFAPGTTDLSMGAARFATVSENNSLGFNVEWEATDNLSFELDVHDSSAESGNDSPFGTAGVLGTADFSLNYQGVDFSSDLPTLSLGWEDPFTDISADRMRATGATIQDSFIRTEIQQIQLVSTYEFDNSIVRSVDFGVSSTTNDYRSTFSNNQRDSWGGVGTPEDYPDDIWQRADLASNFDQFDGYKDTFQDFFIIDFDRLAAALDQPIGGFAPLCGGTGTCINPILETDRRTQEESLAAFFEVDTEFMLGAWPASVVGGVRYEETEVTSEALVPIPTGTQWVAVNEFGFLGTNNPDNRDFTELTGEYDFILPAIDFQVEPREDVVLRASYSKTMTRPSYADIQGGQTFAPIFRIDGAQGSAGNPALEPFLSTNIDFSAEWYYENGSYLSAGYFNKEVENFIGNEVVGGQTPFDVYTPYQGERYDAAVAALGTTDAEAIRQWIFENADPSTFEITGGTPGAYVGNIFGVAGEDPLLEFRISRPVNDDQTKTVDGWEFAWQHLLGDTGFGWILNYTLVDGDVEFDNLSVPISGDVQTPLLGLSNSYNVIGFYDRNGFQVRAAYNWRDKFLTSATGVSGTPNNPLYVEDYGQLDVNASYDVTDRITVFAEGINVTNETSRVVGRSAAYVNFATQTGPRYAVGARFSF